MTPKYFHYISYLQYFFYSSGIYFVFTKSIFKPENYLSGMGFGIFLIGLGFAFGSLSDIEKFSKKEKRILANQDLFIRQTRGILFGSVITFIISMFFISIRFFYISPDPIIAEQYTNLGYGCISFALGLFFDLKQLYEKRIIFNNKFNIN